MTFNKLPVTVLIMTQNEEENIRYALESVLEAFDQVIVTDSFSTDKTESICREYTKVDLYQNEFLSWADQRNWMLNNCVIRNEVVFFLDADEYVTSEFVAELKSILNSDVHFDSMYIFAKYIFLGCHLKYAYGHPYIKRVFRKNGLSFTGAGAREYANKEGIAHYMSIPFIHHERKPIAFWIEKHVRNAEREADLYLKQNGVDYAYTSNLPWRLKVKIWIRNNVWNRLPLLVRPVLYFFIRYIFQRGILDGRAGLIYCYLHAFWYQSLIDIKIIEKKLQGP